MTYRIAQSSLTAHRHCPAIADEALRLAEDILQRTDGTRLRWMMIRTGSSCSRR